MQKLITIFQRIVFFFIGLFLQFSALAQSLPPMPLPLPTADSASIFAAPVGLLQIGDETFISTRLQPEFVLGRVGVGLDVPIVYSLTNNKIREEEYRDGIGVLRMIRYVRYGRKGRDKLAFRLGGLYGVSVGHGTLINNYSNAPSFERRKVGVQFDIHPIEYVGVEGLYSDLNGINIVGIRPYIRPLAFLEDVPVLKNFEIGATYAADFDQYTINARGDRVKNNFVKDGVVTQSVDLGLFLVKRDNAEVSFFAQYGMMNKNTALESTIQKALAQDPDTAAQNLLKRKGLDLDNANTVSRLAQYGNGTALSAGIRAKFQLIANTAWLEARLERYEATANYVPQFFDAFYEIDKDRKLAQVAATQGTGGTYGSLTGLILNKIRLSGVLQLPDLVSAANPAFVRVDLDGTDVIIPNVIAQAQYFKGGFTTFSEAFTLDQRSLLTSRLAYRIFSWAIVGVDYRWTFALVEENGVNRFKAQQYVSPYFAINIPLGGGGNVNFNE
ncbi:MAG: hypothetical protein NZ551_04430 [Microscillaceae bacterium]|nr:hypothetical protein [Microscillaceae bacterium]MDW8460438.1 hypothetical protein [Cytophagales bacterium]